MFLLSYLVILETANPWHPCKCNKLEPSSLHKTTSYVIYSYSNQLPRYPNHQLQYHMHNSHSMLIQVSAQLSPSTLQLWSICLSCFYPHSLAFPRPSDPTCLNSCLYRQLCPSVYWQTKKAIPAQIQIQCWRLWMHKKEPSHKLLYRQQRKEQLGQSQQCQQRIWSRVQGVQDQISLETELLFSPAAFCPSSKREGSHMHGSNSFCRDPSLYHFSCYSSSAWVWLSQDC